ncbi:MAG: site-2 protease family protein [Puniceicoccales bacterium]|jgi:Zn-dependent protease|nr:site-2 protease family protein [Puniceicoccales bacterium]
MSIRSVQEICVGYLWIILALTVHEWGHAYVADRFGDATPRIEGRLTLNPLAHISIIGTVIVPLAILFLSPKFIIMGWGLPVAINANNFKYRKLGDFFCSMAGPFMNFLLGMLILLLGFAIRKYVGSTSFWHLCVRGSLINISLGIFNLLPIPPLDGAHVLKIIAGMKEEIFAALSTLGNFLLIVLINFQIFRYCFARVCNFIFAQFLSVGKFLFF